LTATAALHSDTPARKSGSRTAKAGRTETPVRALLRLLQIASYKARGDVNPADLTPMSHQVAALILKAAPAEQVSLIDSLAHASWPQTELITGLCALPASRCAPLLRHSPVLDQASLWQIVQNGEEGHALSLCARSDLGPDLLDKLIRRDDPALWLALLNNPQVDWQAGHIDRLIGRAHTHLGLRAALARHPALSVAQAERLLGFVGPHLKAELLQRIAPSGAQVIPAAARFNAARGTWLNRLYHGDLEGCRTAMARHLNLPVPVIDKALRSAATLTLTFRALGVDQAAFPALFQRLRTLSGLGFDLDPSQRRLLRPLLQMSAEEAGQRLRDLPVAHAG